MIVVCLATTHFLFAIHLIACYHMCSAQLFVTYIALVPLRLIRDQFRPHPESFLGAKKQMEDSMPVITVAMHPTTAEMKKSLIAALTETAVKVTGVPEQAFTIFIDEHQEESIGVGGRTLKDIRSSQS